jgi:ring-1,2-phenylacetyl-CoA epoxidase subunit PaaB
MWNTYEVFHQDKRGKQHVHVGTVHAPDPEMALVLAKEQYARRLNCVNLWVVKTSDVYAFSYEDEDMFATTPGKIHREAAAYKTRDKIEEYKKRKAATP